MTLIIQLIQSAGKTSTVLEDAFLVVGSLASGKSKSKTIASRNLLTFLCSPRRRLCPIHSGFLNLSLPCPQSPWGHTALHGCRWHYRWYLTRSRWTKCAVCWTFHDRPPGESAEWYLEPQCQDLYFVLLWWYCSCDRPCLRALLWDYDGCSSTSRRCWAQPRTLSVCSPFCTWNWIIIIIIIL